MKRLDSLPVVGLLLMLGGCAHFGPPKGWAVSRSRNVKVYTNAWIEHEFMQEWLELSHAAYQALFPDVKTGVVDAVWLKEEPGGGTRFFGPLDDPQAGWTLETMPSDGKIGRDGLIVLERRDELVANNRGSFTAHSTRDEGLAKSQMAHLFIMKAVPLAPLWLQVGLARYMSKFRIHYKGDHAVACFGSVVFDEPIRAGDTGRRVMIPLAELFNTDWYGYDRKKRYWYEYTAYALVHFLVHGERGFNKTRFPKLLTAIREGQSTEDALATAYPQILPSEWDDLLELYVRPHEGPAMIAENRNIPQGMCLTVPPVRLAEEKPRKTPADAYDIEVMLDDLARVDPFHRHSSWMPHEVVEAEAAKRPRGPRSPRPGPETGEDKSGVPVIKETAH
jgi:hypothetical protein